MTNDPCKHINRDRVIWAMSHLQAFLQVIPQNAIANAKYLHIKAICRTVGWHVISSCPLIWCQFNLVPAQSVQSLLLLQWWSSITELPDWPIREGMDSTSCLLIATFSFPCTRYNTGGKFTRSTTNYVAFHHIMVEDILEPLIKNSTGYTPGDRDYGQEEEKQRWETNWLWVKSLAQMMTSLVQH